MCSRGEECKKRKSQAQHELTKQTCAYTHKQPDIGCLSVPVVDNSQNAQLPVLSRRSFVAVLLTDLTANKCQAAYVIRSRGDKQASPLPDADIFTLHACTFSDLKTKCCWNRIDTMTNGIDISHCFSKYTPGTQSFLSISPSGRGIALSFYHDNKQISMAMSTHLFHSRLDEDGRIIEPVKNVPFKHFLGRAVYLAADDKLALINKDVLQIYYSFDSSTSFVLTRWFDLKPLFNYTPSELSQQQEQQQQQQQELYNMKITENASWTHPCVDETFSPRKLSSTDSIITNLSWHIKEGFLLTLYKEPNITRVWSIESDGIRLLSLKSNGQVKACAFSSNLMAIRFGDSIQIRFACKFCGKNEQYLVMAAKRINKLVFTVSSIALNAIIVETSIDIDVEKNARININTIQPFIIERCSEDDYSSLEGYYTKFINQDTTEINQVPIDIYDKAIPPLHIHGASNSGGWQLISGSNFSNDDWDQVLEELYIQDSIIYLYRRRIGRDDHYLKIGKYTVQLWQHTLDEHCELLYMRAFNASTQAAKQDFHQENWRLHTTEHGGLHKNTASSTQSKSIRFIKDSDGFILTIETEKESTEDWHARVHQFESACLALYYLRTPPYAMSETQVEDLLRDYDSVRTWHYKFILFKEESMYMASKFSYFTTRPGSNTLATLASFDDGRPTNPMRLVAPALL
ncbi:hypothetical protein [Parasitella parasitica]|uniref:Uncharacterized protein n=1 Tax=Parasitella parasitica TaxID=35722 RepID=A0A0B7MVN8_9FUNG|nr:hypothetical protein [Parasitella parasitica]